MKLFFLLVCFLIQLSANASGNPYDTCTNQQAGNLKFIVLSDLHVSPGAQSETDLISIISEINETTADFVVVTGDLTNTGSDDELLTVKKALNGLKHTLYVLPGNHETNWSESAGLKFSELWGNDRFIARHKGFMLVGFSTGPFMRMGDGLVKLEDTYWLNKELGKKKADENLIAFSHYPLAEGLSNWFEVTGILKKAGCSLVFCGHGHSLRLYNFDGIPGIMCRSVILGKSPVPGYSLVQLRNDSVLVFNKYLRSEPGRAEIALNYSKTDALSSLNVSSMPDYSINSSNTNYEIISCFKDSSSIFTGPCAAGKLIVWANSSGTIKGVDKITGSVVWREQVAAPVYSTPVYSGGIVMIGTVDGKIIGIDAENGRRLWTVNTGRPVLGEGIIDDGFLYIGGGDREFFKVHCRSGKLDWKFTGVSGIIQGRPAISASSVFFGAWDRNFYCLDRETGDFKWQWDNGKSQVLYSPGNIYPVSSGNRVFIVAPDRFMTAIDEKTGRTIWRTGRHTVRESMGASADGSLIYAKLMNDSLIAVSATRDIPVTEWKVNAGFGYEHNPCPVTAAATQVLTATRDGVLISIDPVSHEVIWKYKAGNSSVNRITVDEDDIIWCTLGEGLVVGIKSVK